MNPPQPPTKSPSEPPSKDKGVKDDPSPKTPDARWDTIRQIIRQRSLSHVQRRIDSFDPTEPSSSKWHEYFRTFPGNFSMMESQLFILNSITELGLTYLMEAQPHVSYNEYPATSGLSQLLLHIAGLYFYGDQTEPLPDTGFRWGRFSIDESQAFWRELNQIINQLHIPKIRQRFGELEALKNQILEVKSHLQFKGEYYGREAQLPKIQREIDMLMDYKQRIKTEKSELVVNKNYHLRNSLQHILDGKNAGPMTVIHLMINQLNKFLFSTAGSFEFYDKLGYLSELYHLVLVLDPQYRKE